MYDINMSGNLIEQVAFEVALAAESASKRGTYGVAAALICANNIYDANGKIIYEQYQIIKIQENQVYYEGRKINPTGHAEFELVNWYYRNRKKNNLPEPEELICVTSLGSCPMCAGVLAAAGIPTGAIVPDPSVCELDRKWPSWWTEQQQNLFAFFKVIDGNGNVVRPFTGGKEHQLSNAVISEMVHNKAYGAAHGTINDVRAIPDNLADNSVNLRLLYFYDLVIIEKHRKKQIQRAEPDDLNQIRTITERYNKRLKGRKNEYAKKIKAIKTKFPTFLATDLYLANWEEGLSDVLVQVALQELENDSEQFPNAAAIFDENGEMLLCVSARDNQNPTETAILRLRKEYAAMRWWVLDECDIELPPESRTKIYVLQGPGRLSPTEYSDMATGGSANNSDIDGVWYVIPNMPAKDVDDDVLELPLRYVGKRGIVPEHPTSSKRLLELCILKLQRRQYALPLSEYLKPKMNVKKHWLERCQPQPTSYYSETLILPYIS